MCQELARKLQAEEHGHKAAMQPVQPTSVYGEVMGRFNNLILMMGYCQYMSLCADAL